MTTRLLLPLLVAAVPAAARADWTNALKPAGQPGPELTLVADGQPRYAVLLPERPTPQEQTAADHLRHWIKEITGATLPDTRPHGPFVHISTDRRLADE